MDKMKINIEDLLLCVSNAQDVMSPNLSKHQQQVANLAFRIAEEVGLSPEAQKDIFLASLVHDIGVLSKDERLEILETESMNINNHAFKGATLIEGFFPLNKASKIIKYHHLAWNNGQGSTYCGEEVPFESHIIHLADRTCALIRTDRNILSQLPAIISAISKKTSSLFVPLLIDALVVLSKKEYIWLDIASNYPVQTIQKSGILKTVELEIDDIIDLTHIFSQIIDFKSSFTARHSVGVAKVAEHLAQLIGFSNFECKMMLIAGYLHDLGKVAISNEILDKESALTENEFNEIRSHTYYTFQLLEPIAEFKTIRTWASYHHEKINGNGYPFHIKGQDLSIGSRVVAVADVFTAITEDRPYRKRMEEATAKQVLNNMVEDGSLDERIVRILVENFQKINEVRNKGQEEDAKHYENFLRIE